MTVWTPHPKVHDQLMRDAVNNGASLVTDSRSRGSFLETYLEDGLIAALDNLRPGISVLKTGGGTVGVTGWDRKIGGYDLTITLPGSDRPDMLVETKVSGLEETHWDFLKLCTGLGYAARSGYLVVAARSSDWSSDPLGLFKPEGGFQDWTLDSVLAEWQAGRLDMLYGGTGRPLQAPEMLTSRFIARAPVPAFSGYEIRCVRVESPPDCLRIDLPTEWLVYKRAIRPESEKAAETLTDRSVLFRGEGGRVETARDGKRYCLLVDEGTMLDFLPKDDRELQALTFQVLWFITEADRNAYAEGQGWR